MNAQPSAPATSTLLYLDASPRGERSQSRKLGAKFLATWRAANPTATVIARDVGREPPPFVTEAWVEGAFTASDQHSSAARDAIAVSNRYVDELLAADQIVIATPIYNLSLPAALKAWIDQVVRVGRTFSVNGGAFEGLVKNKRVIVIVTSGGDYRPTSAAAAYNFLEPYLRAVLGFIGLTAVEFVYAHSLAAGGSVSDQGITDAHSALHELARARAA